MRLTVDSIFVRDLRDGDVFATGDPDTSQWGPPQFNSWPIDGPEPSSPEYGPAVRYWAVAGMEETVSGAILGQHTYTLTIEMHEATPSGDRVVGTSTAQSQGALKLVDIVVGDITKLL